VSWLSDEAIARLQVAATWPEFGNDRYTVVDEIGRGGMGTVYLARDEALGREVAIKVSNAVASEALERRIRTEARILARLEHPGIVPIHDVGRLVDGRLFYVMKRVRGETLARFVREGPSQGDVLRVFERICDAVAFAHAHGCIHRDLKPENIMVGAYGEVMVMDWGIAKDKVPPPEGGSDADPIAATDSVVVRSRQTDAGTVLGTPGYMPPEQASGDADGVDERADVYGLGAILYMVLAGDPPPLAGASAAGLRESGRAVSRPLQAICARALAADPLERYPRVEALALDVARYRSGQAVDAHPETLFERTRRVGWTYRTPILLVLGYLIMRVVVALTAGW
jgi:serine/threonine protein kinase